MAGAVLGANFVGFANIVLIDSIEFILSQVGRVWIVEISVVQVELMFLDLAHEAVFAYEVVRIQLGVKDELGLACGETELLDLFQ